MLSTLRHLRGLTQEDVARQLGIRANYYSRMERGDRMLTPDRLRIIRQLFELDEAEYLRLVDWAADQAEALRAARQEAA